MRILVTGSRTWEDPSVIHDALLEAAEDSTDSDPIVLVHGTADGADMMAEGIALGFGWQVERHPADWSQHGRRAGYVRNAEMVATNPDVCLAFIRDHSRGASMCADLASKKGIPLRIWTELT